MCGLCLGHEIGSTGIIGFMSARPRTGAPPSVSVVMTAYNGERHLDEAVGSILGQSVEDLELIVVDDASTDRTLELLSRLAASDPRLVVIRHDRNRGHVVALQTACARARGRYVARLDADDAALPDRLAHQIAFLDADPAVGVVGTAAIFTDEHGREFARFAYPTTCAEIRARLESGSSAFVHSTVTMRRDALDAAGGYRLAPRGEDLDLWLRLVERYDAANLAEPLVRYRVHPNQATARSTHDAAVCGLVAVHAARCRSAGKPDPLDGVELVDDAFAANLGIERAAIERHEIRRTVWYAGLLFDAGYAREASSLLADAHAVAWRGRHGDELRAVRRARVRVAPTRADSVRQSLRHGLARLGALGRAVGAWRG